MPERYFDLTAADRREALLAAASHLGRPADLLEKDIYVVLALEVLGDAPFARDVVFKGGTSLSKAYRVIDRFSEDVDLTVDARALARDVVGDGHPRSRTQAERWSKVLRERLARWVVDVATPRFRSHLTNQGVAVDVHIDVDSRANHFDLHLTYEAEAPRSTGYVRPTVKLEFGARGLGDPRTERAIRADAAEVPALHEIDFPHAVVSVLTAERTFWEKATAAHVYAVRGTARGPRDSLARHWFDLSALDAAGVARRALADRDLALDVAQWKSWFFRERGVDYAAAVSGELVLIPQGAALDALRSDYAAMVEAGLLRAPAPAFEAVMDQCARLERLANHPRTTAADAPPDEEPR